MDSQPLNQAEESFLPDEELLCDDLQRDEAVSKPQNINSSPPVAVADDLDHRDEDIGWDSDPPDPNRPNKWHGPASTWRNWTSAEREVAKSLEQLKTKDLSVHLYNVHKLKTRAKALEREASANGPSGKEIWQPPKLWTAWPMTSDEVPRFSQATFDEPSTYGRNVEEPYQPQRTLEDILLGVVTRIARERFNSRKAEQSEEEITKDAVLPETEVAHETDIDDTGAETSSMRSLSRTQDIVLSSESDISVDVGFEVSRETLRDSSGVASDRRAESSEEVSKRFTRGRRRVDVSTQYRPVPLMDDELARQLTLPSIRDLTSNLQRLLDGLHHNRKHYTTRTVTGELYRSRSTKRKAPASKAGLSEDMDTAEDPSQTDLATEDHNAWVEKHRPRRQQNIFQSFKEDTLQRYGLRDWRAILSIATLQGWDPVVVEKAKARCHNLFNEDMQPIHPLSQGFKVNKEQGEEFEGNVRVDGFLRPIKRLRGWRGPPQMEGSGSNRTTSKSKAESNELANHSFNESKEDGVAIKNIGDDYNDDNHKIL
jgi:hypothetical protein